MKGAFRVLPMGPGRFRKEPKKKVHHGAPDGEAAERARPLLRHKMFRMEALRAMEAGMAPRFGVGGVQGV